MDTAPKSLTDLRAELVGLSAERLALQAQLNALPFGPGYLEASKPLKERLLEIENESPIIRQKISRLVQTSQTTLL